jgi:hypothetical protein
VTRWISSLRQPPPVLNSKAYYINEIRPVCGVQRPKGAALKYWMRRSALCPNVKAACTGPRKSHLVSVLLDANLSRKTLGTRVTRHSYLRGCRVWSLPTRFRPGFAAGMGQLYTGTLPRSRGKCAIGPGRLRMGFASQFQIGRGDPGLRSIGA